MRCQLGLTSATDRISLSIMKTFQPFFLVVLITLTSATSQAGEWRSIFDGETLDGWSCIQEGVFQVEDGAIVATNTEADPIPDNRFLIWQGGKPGDFDLKLKFKIEGPDRANSGIQFRGTTDDTGHLIGYQADIDRAGKWLGALYDEHTGRKALAKRGERTVISYEGDRETTELADAAELMAGVDLDGWNEYHISARGHRITLRINGVVMCEVIDEEQGEFDPAGLLALQIHKGPPMVIRFKDIQILEDK